MDQLDQSSMGIMKIVKAQNQNPAEIQITAEQLIRESHAYKLDEVVPQKRKIIDQEEMEDYMYTMRKDFEDKIRRQTQHMGNWIKYGEWEAQIGEFHRARSVFERALDIDNQNVTLWLKYAEMEMKNQFLNHSRNLWERACTLLP